LKFSREKFYPIHKKIQKPLKNSSFTLNVAIMFSKACPLNMILSVHIHMATKCAKSFISNFESFFDAWDFPQLKEFTKGHMLGFFFSFDNCLRSFSYDVYNLMGRMVFDFMTPSSSYYEPPWHIWISRHGSLLVLINLSQYVP
jgi:hypothetical protein